MSVLVPIYLLLHALSGYFCDEIAHGIFADEFSVSGVDGKIAEGDGDSANNPVVFNAQQLNQKWKTLGK